MYKSILLGLVPDEFIGLCEIGKKAIERFPDIYKNNIHVGADLYNLVSGGYLEMKKIIAEDKTKTRIYRLTALGREELEKISVGGMVK